MIAASNGSTEILKAMGRGPSLLNLKDADGGTAAMSAAVHIAGDLGGSGFSFDEWAARTFPI